MASATSAASPSSAQWDHLARACKRLLRARPVMSVSTTPGATTLTVIERLDPPHGPWLEPAHQAGLRGGRNWPDRGAPRTPPTEETKMMRPRRGGASWRWPAWPPETLRWRLVASTSSQASSPMRSTRVSRVIPAFETKDLDRSEGGFGLAEGTPRRRRGRSRRSARAGSARPTRGLQEPPAPSRLRVGARHPVAVGEEPLHAGEADAPGRPGHEHHAAGLCVGALAAHHAPLSTRSHTRGWPSWTASPPVASQRTTWPAQGRAYLDHADAADQVTNHPPSSVPLRRRAGGVPRQEPGARGGEGLFGGEDPPRRGSPRPARDM